MLLCFCLSSEMIAQGSDMIVLKKGPEKTLKTYVSGTQIHFVTIAGTEVHGQIRMIKKDSLFINIMMSVLPIRCGALLSGIRFL